MGRRNDVRFQYDQRLIKTVLVHFLEMLDQKRTLSTETRGVMGQITCIFLDFPHSIVMHTSVPSVVVSPTLSISS